MSEIITNNNIVDCYLLGHNYEFEIRNTFKIFDLNSKINFLYDDKIEFNDFGLTILSEIINSSNSFACKTVLYVNKTQFTCVLVDKNDIIIEKDDEKKLKKTVVKKSLYNALSKYYEEESDYGLLTGVRPNKILISSVKNNISRDDINLILKNTYEVSDEKIKLLNEIFDRQEKYIFDTKSCANNEKNFYNDENDLKEEIKKYNLYIHIPFCPTRCNYCSFVSFSKYNQSVLDEYVENIKYEIDKTINLAIESNLKLNTIYFGGGTPSVLSVKNIDDIFEVIKRYYILENVVEISFEAGRPDTVNKEKLECLKRNCVNRISINPQTMNENTLLKMSRAHCVKDIENAYNLARQIGFNSINMDLIIGLPDENPEDVLNSIEKVIKLRPDNITVHALSYKRGSILINNIKDLSRDTDIIKDMYQITRKMCTENGYKPYYMYRQKNIKGNLDNIGYALESKESIYNIAIIEEIETILACGAGAVSKILMGDGSHQRVQNYKDLKEYNKNVQKNIDDKFKKINDYVL